MLTDLMVTVAGYTGRQLPMNHSALAYTIGQSSLGTVLIAGSRQGLRAILLGDDEQELIIDLQRRFGPIDLICSDAALDGLLQRVIAMIEQPTVAPPIPLDMHGTPFQMQVWNALLQVPAGRTVTYTQLAESLGRPRSARAVAQACAANALAVAVPCHRVIRADGGLSGYRWNVDRKRQLLARERA